MGAQECRSSGVKSKEFLRNRGVNKNKTNGYNLVATGVYRTKHI